MNDEGFLGTWTQHYALLHYQVPRTKKAEALLFVVSAAAVLVFVCFVVWTLCCLGNEIVDYQAL